MNTITLTLQATPENLRKLADAFAGIADLPYDGDRQQLTAEPRPQPKKEKPAPEKTETETKPEPAEEVTKDMIKAEGLKLNKAGKSLELKAIFAEFGVDKLSDAKEEDYAAIYERIKGVPR